MMDRGGALPVPFDEEPLTLALTKAWRTILPETRAAGRLISEQDAMSAVLTLAANVIRDTNDPGSILPAFIEALQQAVADMTGPGGEDLRREPVVRT